MAELAEIFEATDSLQELRESDLPDLDLRELMLELNRLVSAELSTLAGLGDDAEENEERLRAAIVNVAFRAFYAGLAVGGESTAEAGIVVSVPSETLEAIGLQCIRDGVMTFTLTTPVENDVPQ